MAVDDERKYECCTIIFYTSAIKNMATVLQFDVTICQVYHGQNLYELEFRQRNVQKTV
jgi:hypothetical protein